MHKVKVQKTTLLQWAWLVGNMGQLESEMDAIPPRSPAMSWLVLDYDPQLIFGAKTKDFWEKCVQKSIEEKSKEIVDKAFSTLHRN